MSGWQEESALGLKQFIKDYMKEGVKYVICTDISKDGMLEGAAVNLYKDLISTNPNMALIASGGVTTMNDLIQLNGIGCEGAIIGKAIYEGRIGLKELENFIINN